LSGLLAEVDTLYEACVMDPDRWQEQAFIDWADGVSVGYSLDRTSAKYVRRSMTMGTKLAAFWSAHAELRGTESWRSRVDIAMGARAWRPQLDLAEYLLHTSPTEDVFDVVVELFPLVRNQPFMDGIAYEEWLETRPLR
jgi:hypothetical protein